MSGAGIARLTLGKIRRYRAGLLDNGGQKLDIADRRAAFRHQNCLSAQSKAVLPPEPFRWPLTSIVTEGLPLRQNRALSALPRRFEQWAAHRLGLRQSEN